MIFLFVTNKANDKYLVNTNQEIFMMFLRLQEVTDMEASRRGATLLKSKTKQQ